MENLSGVQLLDLEQDIRDLEEKMMGYLILGFEANFLRDMSKDLLEMADRIANEQIN